MRNAMAALVCSVLAGCAQSPVASGRPHPVELSIATDAPLAEVDPRYLSVALDAAQVTGGHFWSPDAKVESGAGTRQLAPYDFGRTRLRNLTHALAPAYLRIGGTEADTLAYDLGTETGSPTPISGATAVLTRAEWIAAMDFARATELRVIFTLGAGPPWRDTAKAWNPGAARRLVTLAAERGDPVDAWELGNEVNAFEVLHGLSSRISGEQYARDYAQARALVHERMPGAQLLGPASAFWPILGEPRPVLPGFLKAAGNSVDGVSWHFYPQQSRRCPVAVRRASPELALDPSALDEAQHWADAIRALRDRHAPSAQLWVTETGTAQCGGEPGLSDTFAGSFFWLDELGVLARAGVRVVARQTLSGSDYGLLEETTLAPRPDYWISLLWKRRMGTRVLRLDVRGSPKVRAYAHCAPAGNGAVAIAWLNLDAQRPAILSVPRMDTRGAAIDVVTASSLVARDVRLNGTPLALDEAGLLPLLSPREIGALSVPPESLGFVTLPLAHARACMP